MSMEQRSEEQTPAQIEATFTSAELGQYIKKDEGPDGLLPTQPQKKFKGHALFERSPVEWIKKELPNLSEEETVNALLTIELVSLIEWHEQLQREIEQQNEC